MATTTLSWLHISDLHIMDSSLLKVIIGEQESFAKQREFSFIVVTGDLRDKDCTCKEDKYTKAKEYLEKFQGYVHEGGTHKYKKGYICGFFDLIHDGHIEILKYAKSMCNYLIVAVGIDEFMEQRKSRSSVLSYDQRVKIVSSLKYVDEVVPQTGLDKVGDYHKYNFDVMFAGDDHIDEEVYINATKELKELGVDVIYFKRVEDVSSTKIREKIKGE